MMPPRFLLRYNKWVHLCLYFLITSVCFDLQGQNQQECLDRHTLIFDHIEREYFVQLPAKYEVYERYWLVILVHGGGGNGRTFFLAEGVGSIATEMGLEAIIVSPSFSNEDFLASRFPSLGEGRFLKAVLKELRRKFKVHKKILLSGYSRGGQFTHRFALQNPRLVKACAPFAAGTWTTPDGKLLVEAAGEIVEPSSYLTNTANASMVPERLRNLFQPRVAEVAGTTAHRRARKVPFLVMCGSLDPRFKIANRFADSLTDQGYLVQTEWPKTPHGDRTRYRDEFVKYSRGAVDFFLIAIENNQWQAPSRSIAPR